MRRVVLIFVAIVVILLLIGGVGAATTPPATETNLMHQTMVTNMCAFPILVEFRHDGMGMVEMASCPAFGTDMIGELWRGGHEVLVTRVDTGVLFTRKHIMVGDMHHTVKIHPDGAISLHP
jgi:hypothetical protein